MATYPGLSGGSLYPYKTGSTPPAPYGVIPAFTPLAEKLKTNYEGALAGELPQDVKDQISNYAAERGVASGMPGSQWAGYQGLRQLGLTSLNRMDEARNQLTPYLFRNIGLPPANQNNQSSTWNTGSITPPLAHQPSQPQAPQMPKGAPQGGGTTVGDILSKYGMSPLGVNNASPNTYNPFAATNGTGNAGNFSDAGGGPGLGGVPMFGTFQSPKQDWNYDTSDEAQLSNLADLGIADPSWANAGNDMEFAGGY